MSTATKVGLTLVVFVVGSIIAGIIKEVVVHGQYLTSGAMVLIFFYIWSRPKAHYADRKKTSKNKLDKSLFDV